MIQPPYAALRELQPNLKKNGFALLNRADVAQWIGCKPHELDQIAPSWAQLPSDQYLLDGGRYRTRRHSCFIFDQQKLMQVPHRAHWQPVTYNALHGGIERWFEPIEPATADHFAFKSLMTAFGALAESYLPTNSAVTQRCIEAHQFRIGTDEGIGRPTPEGAHRDGVDLVAVFMVARHAVKGGETRVFDAFGSHGERFTLDEPWSLLLLDDAKMIHESTPIQPISSGGYRDTLVLTSRLGGFQAK
jgi:hypothetical protein